ncbi:MAG TPA: type II toxin-antitoxin system RelE/ParE family toxin [Catalimonadaceae bacterium]|nr:type II toxin-antitoxin system RelE/ParE family toxin [Catalimonadaceae bacterium]
MIVTFDSSFLKSLKKLRDKGQFLKVEQIILECEKVESLEKIRNCKKLVGFESFYRIRIGDYRLGFELVDANTIHLITLAHRKEIYRGFP